jgi:hypothetical protein
MFDISQLTPHSTIGNLPTHHFQVTLSTPGKLIAKTFAYQPEIPGVIVMKGPQISGMISRNKFQEWMSQPYNTEFYMERPIQMLLDFVKTPPLQLPDVYKIDEAARIALNRSEDLVYEPIVVVYEQKIFRLLDMRILLLGQTQMLTLYHEMIRMQKLENYEYLTQLQKEKEKIKGYTKLLEFNLIEIQKQNQQLTTQQSKLLQQTKRIGLLNQKFIQIGQILSKEGREAFQATFTGVNGICKNTDQIVDIGRALAKELETINTASRLISQVSQQVRYLAVQAAVIANRSEGRLNEFSKVTSEIGKLVSQTFDAGRQMDRLANRFKLRVNELTESARNGATVAKALIQKIDRAEKALFELEQLVDSQTSTHPSVQQMNRDAMDILEAQSLLQKLEQTEGALSELEELVQHQDLIRLIQTIEGVLSRNQQRMTP